MSKTLPAKIEAPPQAAPAKIEAPPQAAPAKIEAPPQAAPAKIEAPPHAAPTPHETYSVSALERMAAHIAASGLFPGLTTSQAAFTLMLLCQSEGLHPAQAMRRYHVIDGRPAMRADAMQAEFQRQGGRVVWHRSDAEVCEATFVHATHAPDGSPVRVTFAELDKAGVTRGKYGIKDNWRKFPRQMLRARCISEGVRMVLPGVVCGIYSPEEVADIGPTPAPFPTIVAAPAPRPVPAQERWERFLDKCMARWEEAHPAEDPDDFHDRRLDIIAHVVERARGDGRISDDDRTADTVAVDLWATDEAWSKATVYEYLRAKVTPPQFA